MLALFWLMMNNPWRVRTWVRYYGSLFPSRRPADFDDYLKQLRDNLSEPGRFDAVKRLGSSSRRPLGSLHSEGAHGTLVFNAGHGKGGVA